MPYKRPIPNMTLVARLAALAADQPDALLYREITPDTAASRKWVCREWSYRETQWHADRVAGFLQTKLGDTTSVMPPRVVIAMPAGLDYIAAYLGCLRAGAIAVPAYPPRRPQRSERLHAILADSGARLILAHASLTEMMSSSNGRMASNVDPSVQWQSIEAIDDANAAQVRPTSINSDDIAFLQYTSGSSGTPKGVAVTHGNLVHNQSLIQSSFVSDVHDAVVGWLPPHHDMGLIGNVLHPLYLGASLTLMKPIDFLQSPVRWLRALADFGGTISGGPNFAYRLCVDEIDDADLDGLDLSRWQVAFNGAEPIDADVIDAFSDRFESVGFDRRAFCPCYGMAETTLLVTSATRMRGVTCHKREHDEGTRRVSCGSAHQE
ncbi:MAG: AMP-binding protein, partial [Planctomycetota bacterium]